MWQFAIPSQCCSPSVQISPFHPRSSHQLYPLFLFVSCLFLPPMSLGLGRPCQALSIYFYCMVRFECSFFFLFDFFMQDISLNNFKSQSLAFLYLCNPFASLLLFLPLCHFFFFFLCLSRSPTLCVHAQQRLKEALEQKVWVYTRTGMRERERVPVSLTLPLCQCLPLGCQWQSEFICCVVTGLMIDVAPANSKPIRRLM